MSKFRLSLIPPVLILGAIALSTAVAVQAADPPRYATYYKIFDRGGALIPGKDSQFVPQGLAYWPEQDALVISYYDSKGGKSAAGDHRPQVGRASARSSSSTPTATSAASR